MPKKRVNRTIVNIPNVVVSDCNNGEILGKTDDNTKIIIESTIEDTEYDKKHELIDIGTGENFVKMIRGNKKFMIKYLTNKEIVTLLFLSDFICYDDCALRKNGDPRGHLLNIHELAKELDVEYNTLRKPFCL